MTITDDYNFDGIAEMIDAGVNDNDLDIIYSNISK